MGMPRNARCCREWEMPRFSCRQAVSGEAAKSVHRCHRAQGNRAEICQIPSQPDRQQPPDTRTNRTRWGCELSPLAGLHFSHWLGNRVFVFLAGNGDSRALRRLSSDCGIAAGSATYGKPRNARCCRSGRCRAFFFDQAVSGEAAQGLARRRRTQGDYTEICQIPSQPDRQQPPDTRTNRTR